MRQDKKLSQLNSSNYAFWGTVISSLLSLIFSGTYYFSFRHQSYVPIACYRYSFELQSQQIRRNYIHSHWRIQSCISRAFQTPSPTLVIIDQCYNTPMKKFSSKEIIVNGRILLDSNTENLHHAPSISGNSASQRTQHLFKLLCDAFDLNEATAKLHSFNGQQIKPNEKVYDIGKKMTTYWNSIGIMIDES